MRNEVNRALVAKKNDFQSKAVPRGTRTIWRYLSALFILFTFAIGNVWGADLEIPLTNLKNFPLDYGLVKITNTENTSISSNQLQVSKKTAKFKVSTTLTGFYIKSISFTDANASKNGGFTCDEGSYMSGPSSDKYTYTAPNATTTEANFSLIGSGGTAKMGTIVVTLSTSEQVERLTAFGSISDSKIPFTSSAATSNVELSVPASNAVSTSSSRISIGSGGKHLIVSTKNSKVLKNIIIPKYQQSTYEITGSSDPAGTYNKTTNVWTPTAATNTSVDLTLTVSSTVYSQEIFVIYANAAPVTNYTVTIDPNGGSYASTPDGWTYSAGVYTKSIASGTSFSAPAGLTKGTDELSWKDGDDNAVTFPTTISAAITFVAQWTPVSAAPTISAHPSTTDVQYIKDATATALSVTASGSGTVTYQWYSNTTASNTDGTILENCTTATYTPSTASTGKLYYYCEVTNTETSKSPKTIKSNVSGLVRVVPAPTHLVENVMATSGTWDSYIVSANAHISNLKTITASEGKTLIKSGKEEASSSRTPGITSNSSSTLVDGDYIYLQFTIEDGYELTVSDASVQVFSISNPGKYVARISDNAATPNVIATDETSVAKSADKDLFDGYDFSSSPTLTGTVTLKLFAYGWSDGYRMKSPIYIDGEVKAVGACTTPTIAWDGDQPADAYVSDGTKTFKVTSNYTDGINLELSSNTCGATIAAKSGSDNKQWVVSFTGAGSVTITPKVAGDGTTYCAGPVSAAAKTLTVTLAHDVTFNMNGHGVDIAKQVVADGGKATAPYVADVADWVFGGWYTDAECTEGNEFDFANTTISAATPLYAKWTADACAGDRQSLSKVVLTNASAGTVTGYNGNEYAGTAVIAGLSDTQTADLGSGTVTGYKMNNGGSAIVFATLKKGSFQEGDKVVIGITKKNDAYKIDSKGQPVLRVYYGTDASDATLLTTIEGATAPGYYTYRLTEADVTAIGSKKGIGLFRESSNGQNPYVYSVEITGCRSFAVSHDVTFDMKSHGTQVAKQTIEVGAKVTEPAEQEVAGYVFGGWYKETTLVNKWNFSTDVMPDNDITLYAKWTEDPCTDRQSLSKVVLTANDNGTVTGYNSKEYAGEAIIASLDKSEDADIIGDETKERGYKLNSGGNSIVMATLKKGNFQEGDKVIVGITKVNDQRTIDASTAIMTIYAGSDKDHMMEVATIKNVNAAGFYTYRLTAANAAAINEAGYKSIGLFRASSNGQNHYVYSVEITGCRDWAELHSVSYNLMGHGTPIAPQVVAKGDKVTKPTNPVETDWAFCGWYKEEGLVNEWNFASDVMGTSDITLYAKWESEAGAIKLFDGEGNLNTTNFVSAPKNADPITIETVDYPCLTQFAANRTSLGGAVPADFVQYNATTDAAKVKFTLYNTNSGEKSALLYMVEEGDTEFTPVEIKVPGQTIFTTSYYTFNSTKNRSFYLCAKDRSNIRVLQVTVMDNGTAIKQAGQAGYSMNFNKGRMYVKNGTPASFEGATINVSSEYKVANNSSLATTSYISFTTTVDKMVLKVTRAGGNYYVSQDPENKGTTYNKNEEIELSPAGTWYLGSTSSGSAASFSKIEFIAPKCAEPEFNALVNSELCEGDAYVALDGTATVADAGVPVYQWYNADGDVLIEGAESATYTPTADGSYYVIATNKLAGYSDNEKKSATVTVEHFASAEITSAPADVRQTVGENATLTVVATGKAPLNYQWYTCDENGDNAVLIAGAEEASYTVNVTANLDQFYKVVVTSGCGEASAVAHVVEWVALPQVNVSASTTWDWVNAGENIKLSGTTVPAKNEECVMANVKVGDKMPTNDETFNSQALLFSGENVRAKDGSRYYASVGYMKFTTTIAGKVTVEFSTNTDDKLRGVKINGQASETSDKKATVKTFSAVVPAGEVSIVGYEGETANAYVRISKIIFSTTDVEGADYVRDVTEGRYGTICLPNGGVMVGAEIFELAYYGATSQKFFFDEVPSGEMEAGKPYLFLPREGATQLGVFYTDNANAAAQTVNGFVGYIGANAEDYMQVPDNGNCYIISNNLYRQVMPGGTAYILSNRAYIDMSGATNIEPAKVPGRRRIGLNVEGTNTATGIDAINASEKPMKIMIDGQIYILRGEKMYDVTGKLVK